MFSLSEAVMEKEEHWKVKFRDVTQTYFPQTRVECRYTLSSEYEWSCRDWIGLFKADWTAVTDYHTYVWAPAPENGTAGNCSILFHPSYLPSPGATPYQFVYVNELEEICAVSSLFTFNSPKPLDELVTLEEERNGEEENEGDDLLLVVPRAHVLQSHLESCQEELLQVHNQLRVSSLEVEQHRERNQTEKKEFEMEKMEMRNEMEDLRERLRCSLETIKRMEEKQKDVFKSHDVISEELNELLTERTENQQRIQVLEDDMNNLLQQKLETEAELERMKERVKKLMVQRKAEDDERRSLQMESKRCHEELRVLQERLEGSECSVEVLRRDLSELGGLQSQNQAELHQIRLQAAQTTLQLSHANLNLREGQAAWAKERENLRKNSELDKERVQKLSHELQKKEEWLEEERTEREKLELELGNERACNRELRASVRAMQKEREQQQVEKRELQDHIRVFRLRMESESHASWNANCSTEVISLSAALQKSDYNQLEQATSLNLHQSEEMEPEDQEVELDEGSGPEEEMTEPEQEVNMDVRQKMKREAQTRAEIHESLTSEVADAPLW